MKKFILVACVFSCLVSSGQAGSEIFLFDMKLSGAQVILSNGRNITNHKGYDNQPYFHPNKPLIYYSSFDDSGRSDIKYYNYQTNSTSNLTVTQEREYSPTVTPDEKFISCIIQRDNGVQDLAKYPINGGQPEVLINDLKVGYHAWAGKDQLLLFVLGDSVSNINGLHYYNLATKKDTILANNIGRSLHKIPGQNAMSFVQKITDTTAMVTKFDLAATKLTPIAFTIKGLDHLAWLTNNTMLMSNGNKLFSYSPGIDNSWQPTIVEGNISMLKGITRLAVNADNTKLTIVVSE